MTDHACKWEPLTWLEVCVWCDTTRRKQEQGRAELARVNAKIESLAFRINMRIQNEPRTMGWLLSFFSGANRDYVQEAVWRLVNSGKAKFGEDLRLTACGNNRPEDEK